jgi:hypothetical protein
MHDVHGTAMVDAATWASLDVNARRLFYQFECAAERITFVETPDVSFPETYRVMYQLTLKLSAPNPRALVGYAIAVVKRLGELDLDVKPFCERAKRLVDIFMYTSNTLLKRELGTRMRTLLLVSYAARAANTTQYHVRTCFRHIAFLAAHAKLLKAFSDVRPSKRAKREA